MKFMLLANEPPDDFALRDQPAKFDSYMGEWFAFSAFLDEASSGVSGAALEKPETATVVSVRDGKRRVEDGPFPDVKEQLGGFFIVDAPDLATAAEWAKKCPAACNGHVDVRPVPYLDQEQAS